MTIQAVTTNGVLTIPGAYSSITVQQDNSGLAASGILMLVGEAEAGPDFSLEASLQDNAFGPDQVSDVVAKYRSGPLVDAMRAAAAPSADPAIQGSPSRIILVKTNPSAKASANLVKFDSSNYRVVADRGYGKLGNLITVKVEAATAEVIPTTGAFTYIPAVGTVQYAMRVNGAAEVGGTLSAAAMPSSVVSTWNALTGIAASGGAQRAAAPAGTVALTIVSGNQVQVAFSAALTDVPEVGDTMVIPDGSIIEGASNENIGAYVVTSASATTIVAVKLSDAGKSGATIGTVTAPEADSGTLSGSPLDDIAFYEAVEVTIDAADPLDGRGKSLEIASLTGGTDLLTRTAFALGTVSAVTWVSTSASPKLLTSAAEYAAKLTAARQSDNLSEELIAGGEVALRLGYDGTTATVTVTDTTMSSTVAGGSGAGFSLALKDFRTIEEVATYINSLTGWNASVGSARLGQIAPVALDNVSAAGACTTHGVPTLRLKVDGFRFFQKVSQESVLVQLQSTSSVVGQAGSGLPAPSALAYLAGGTKGGTTAAQVVAAIDALESVTGNFLVPLFSRDAADDIADDLTDASSTYEIDAINAYAKSHVIKMSSLKRRRNRRAFLSKQGTFAEAKEASANIAHDRASMCFQDVRVVNSGGVIVQAQPWMASVVAAGMQAAGFYRGILNKAPNISGVLMADGSFNDRNDTQMEDALLSGLLPLGRVETGGFKWVSDQTTYSRDGNFVYNSIQAGYIADIVALTTAQRMEQAFVGKSVADASAGLAKAYFQQIMNDFVALKLIAPSDDAPSGYKNLVIKLNGPQMRVSVEIKLAGMVYFIPIDFLVSQVQQSA